MSSPSPYVECGGCATMKRPRREMVSHGRPWHTLTLEVSMATSKRKCSWRSLEERFWGKVDVRGPDECWLWTGATNRTGYGNIGAGGRRGRTLTAHRVSLGLSVGAPITKGTHVLHSCDNPPCCNPRHLRIGTAADNARDRVDRGRGRTHPRRGESNYKAKLTRAEAREIVIVYGWGRHSHLRLAQMYGVHSSTVRRIVTGRSYAAETESARAPLSAARDFAGGE